MKTKHILTAMVLPTLLAACTADEIVENNNNVAVDRAEVPAVSFAVEGLDSRLAFNEETFGWDWENTDKFVIFPADNGAAPKKNTFPGDRFSVGSTLISGYEYRLADDGNGYVTDAAMIGEGLYWGYAPSMEKTGRGLISYELATSQDAEYYKSDAAKAFVTPLYEISALNYNKNLPLQMVNWYSTIVLPLKNSTGEDITLNQIVLEVATGEGNPFQVKGLIDINAIGKYVMAYDGEKWDAYQNYDKDKKNDLDLDGDINEFVDNFRKLYMTTTNDDYNMTSSALLLNLDGEVLEAGETKEFYILAPASNGEISCNIRILAEEGYQEITYSNQSNYLKDTKIYHGARKAAFGWQTVKGETTAKAFNIKKLSEGGVRYHYVASYDDMMELINTVNGDIKVYNVGDWKIDAKMADAITASDCYVEFQNGVVYIGSNEKSATATEEIEFTKVGFANKVIVEKNTEVTFTKRTNKYNNNVNGVLVVKEGAEVIAEYGNFYNATFDVEEGGKLTIKETATAGAKFSNGSSEWEQGATVLNEGETTLVAQNKVTVEQNGGTLYLNNKANAGHAFEYYTSYIKFNTEKSFETIVSSTSHLVVNAKTTVDSWWNSELEAIQSATLTINHDLKLNDALTINGRMTVEGKTTGSAKLTNNGVIENNGDARNADIVNNGTFYNNDEADNVTNNGEIVTGRGSHTTVVKTDVKVNELPGRVDNTNEAQVNVTPNRHIVYYTVEDADIDDIEDIDFKKYNVNTLNVKGTLTLDRPFVAGTDKDENDVLTEALSTLVNLQLNKGAVLDIDKNIIANFRNVFVVGDAEIKGWSKNESTLTMYGDVNVYLMNKCVVDAANYNEWNDGYTLEINDVTVKSTGLIKFNTLKEYCGHANDKTYRHVAAKIVTDHASLENWMVGILTTEGDAESEGLYIDGNKAVAMAATVDNASDLKKAVAAGASVTLADDIELAEQLNVEKDMVLDLNGYEISASNAIWNDAADSKTWSLVSVKKANVTIKGNGGIIATENDSYAVDARDGAVLTIEGEGEYVGNISAVYAHGATVYVNGGKFSIKQLDQTKGTSFLLNCIDADYNNVPKKANIIVTGGEFKNFNPCSNGAEGNYGSTNFVKTGYEVKVVGKGNVTTTDYMESNAYQSGKTVWYEVVEVE